MVTGQVGLWGGGGCSTSAQPLLILISPVYSINPQLIHMATPNEYLGRWIRAHPNRGLPLFLFLGKKIAAPLLSI